MTVIAGKLTGAVMLGAVMLLLLVSGAEAGAATPWMAGAAREDITPPAYDSAQDLADFPVLDVGPGEGGAPGESVDATVCPREVFNGVRLWRFEEPYRDVDGSGDFSYPLGTPEDPVFGDDDPVFGDPHSTPVPEPFCDYNHNGRWDGIYISGGVNHLAKRIHDPIDVRAVAISDGSKTIAIASVVAQGIFENYIAEARQKAEAMAAAQPACGRLDGLVVSSNHNESSPDSVGIYGAPEDPTGTFGLNSSIDEHYMSFLVDRIAKAVVDACAARRPATLSEREVRLPPSLEVRLSHNFPTTNDDRSPAAIDPKVRLLDAREADGDPIFTMMNLAAHNQEIGHGPHSGDISADWPGYFNRELEERLGGGMAMFLVADNGSEEDPVTVPPDPNGEGSYEQAQATGEALAAHVFGSLPGTQPIAFGSVAERRSDFTVPMENNLFKAASAAGLFGERQGYTAGEPTGRVGTEAKTSVSVLDVGPDLQFIANPGEAFPALIVGSPWGREEVGCPNRENPPVPTWHASARHRFQIGLANDLIGYEIPAWAYSEQPGIFLNDPTGGNLDSCFNDPDSGLDPAGHKHKLETEGVGPTASNMVAEKLTVLLAQTPDPAAEIRPGRFVKADGSLTRRASEGAVGVWLAEPGSNALTPGSGTIVALRSVGSFGARDVDATGELMDFDGAGQADPDITTRGMLVKTAGAVAKRYYLDVFPPLTGSSLGAANPPVVPPGSCTDETPPSSRISGISVSRHPVRITGRSRDAGCTGTGGDADVAGAVQKVSVSLAWFDSGRCRFLRADGSFSGRRACSNPIQHTAKGTSSWTLRIVRSPLPRGRYRARALARDPRGNVESPDAGNTRTFTVGR
jgi:hypothetical protein